MKTVIFNGSPRKQGATAAVISYLRNHLPGEIIQADSYSADISPCIDCRFCKMHATCSIPDGMQELYRHITEADVLVIASPIYFGQLTGSLLSLASRFQYFWTNPARITSKQRVGGILLTDGGMGVCQDAFAMGKRLLHLLGVQEIQTVFHSGTDRPEKQNPIADPQTLQQIENFLHFAHKMNRNEHSESMDSETKPRTVHTNRKEKRNNP